VICVSATRGDGMDDWLDWLLPPRVDEHLRTRKQPFRGRTGLQQVM
jgi:hydrogenase nickel incorporation protein HypB